MIKELNHIEKMLEVKKQIYLTDSWKRKRDLEKHLEKLEKTWFQYKKVKNNGQTNERN